MKKERIFLALLPLLLTSCANTGGSESFQPSNIQEESNSEAAVNSSRESIQYISHDPIDSFPEGSYFTEAKKLADEANNIPSFSESVQNSTIASKTISHKKEKQDQPLYYDFDEEEEIVITQPSAFSEHVTTYEDTVGEPIRYYQSILQNLLYQKDCLFPFLSEGHYLNEWFLTPVNSGQDQENYIAYDPVLNELDFYENLLVNREFQTAHFSKNAAGRTIIDYEDVTDTSSFSQPSSWPAYETMHYVEGESIDMTVGRYYGKQEWTMNGKDEKSEVEAHVYHEERIIVNLQKDFDLVSFDCYYALNEEGERIDERTTFHISKKIDDTVCFFRYSGTSMNISYFTTSGVLLGEEQIYEREDGSISDTGKFNLYKTVEGWDSVLCTKDEDGNYNVVLHINEKDDLSAKDIAIENGIYLQTVAWLSSLSEEEIAKEDDRPLYGERFLLDLETIKSEPRLTLTFDKDAILASLKADLLEHGNWDFSQASLIEDPNSYYANNIAQSHLTYEETTAKYNSDTLPNLSINPSLLVSQLDYQGGETDLSFEFEQKNLLFTVSEMGIDDESSLVLNNGNSYTLSLGYRNENLDEPLFLQEKTAICQENALKFDAFHIVFSLSSLLSIGDGETAFYLFLHQDNTLLAAIPVVRGEFTMEEIVTDMTEGETVVGKKTLRLLETDVLAFSCHTEIDNS